jgi:LytS/YehU family sensor histidine kinase
VVLIAAFLVWLIVATTKRVVNRNNKAKTMQLELRNLKMAVELKSIYSQINPHFIFNTLSTGLYYIKKKKMDEAYNHISSFSNLLRAYIKSSRNKYITLAEEIENLGNYISLQQSRFENKFDSEIIVANNVNPIKSTIPSLLLQPLVENAINHGLFHKEDKGKLKIEFKQGNDESELICIIDDDGVGRDRAKLFKEEATIQTPSYGTDLVKELINIFNTNEPIRIDIEYIDKQEPETGTTVILTIKNLNNDKHQI